MPAWHSQAGVAAEQSEVRYTDMRRDAKCRGVRGGNAEITVRDFCIFHACSLAMAVEDLCVSRSSFEVLFR